MFTDRNPYHLRQLGKMPARCPQCNLKLLPEAGFYYGAMWISYLVGIILSVIIICVLLFVFHVELRWAFIAFIVFHILFSPYLFKFARSLWLSFYVHQHRDI
jgi:ABC-type polysaccharide/polyol phosphate export permease